VNYVLSHCGGGVFLLRRAGCVDIVLNKCSVFDEFHCVLESGIQHRPRY